MRPAYHRGSEKRSSMPSAFILAQPMGSRLPVTKPHETFVCPCMPVYYQPIAARWPAGFAARVTPAAREAAP